MNDIKTTTWFKLTQHPFILPIDVVSSTKHDLYILEPPLFEDSKHTIRTICKKTKEYECFENKDDAIKQGLEIINNKIKEYESKIKEYENKIKELENRRYKF